MHAFSSLKSPIALALGILSIFPQTTLAVPVLSKRADPKGIDISDFTTDVNFNTVKANGVSFVYIKATEGTSKLIYSKPTESDGLTKGSGFISDLFSSQYDGATSAGLLRGAYHFAHPDESSGATQASFFLSHGGESGVHSMTKRFS